MTKKKYIDAYNTIFDVAIVIANMNVTLKDLLKLYIYNDGTELDEGINDCLATTCCCKNIKTNRPVVLVKLNKLTTIVDKNKKLDLINTASHEAFHVLMDLYRYAGETINIEEHDETSAYFIGWITEIIMQNWTKK